MKVSRLVPHSVRGIPNPLWVIFVLHMLDSFCFFAVAFNLVLYLMQEFQLDTDGAEFYFGVWSTTMLLFAIPTGALIDRLGLRRSLILGALLNGISRLFFAFSENFVISMLALIFVMSFGSGLFQAPLHIAVDRYSTSSAIKSTAFSILYTFSNLGAVAALFFTDFAKSVSDEGYRVLFAAAAAVSMIVLLVTLFFNEMQQREVPRTELNGKVLLETLKERNLWFLLVFTIIILPLMGIFTFMESLLPVYMSITTPEAPISVLTVNPIMIIFLAPTLGTFLSNKTNYPMIVTGGFVSALSVTIMYFWYSSSTYAGVVIPEGVVAFQIVFTIGEAIFSPRIAQFVLEYSPSPKKGLYGGLTPLPAFAGKFLASWISASVLRRWCSTGDAEECRTIWLPIAGLALLTPIFVCLLYLVVHAWLNINLVLNYDFTPHVDEELQEVLEEFDSSPNSETQDIEEIKEVFDPDISSSLEDNVAWV